MPAPLCCRRVERRDEPATVTAPAPAHAAALGAGPADASVTAAAPGVASDDEGGAGAAREITNTITLDETDRHRRRMAMTSDQGLAFVLTLAAATLLRDGDRLVLDDGRRIVVRAAPEPLYEVRGSDPHHLLRLAWHMGNRHLPTQLRDDHLRIRRDAVIGEMLVGLGADVREIEAGFDPEGGAYGDPLSHGHSHGDHPHGDHSHADHVHADPARDRDGEPSTA